MKPLKLCELEAVLPLSSLAGTLCACRGPECLISTKRVSQAELTMQDDGTCVIFTMTVISFRFMPVEKNTLHRLACFTKVATYFYSWLTNISGMAYDQTLVGLNIPGCRLVCGISLPAFWDLHHVNRLQGWSLAVMKFAFVAAQLRGEGTGAAMGWLFSWVN